jgi:hypothetical protein
VSTPSGPSVPSGAGDPGPVSTTWSAAGRSVVSVTRRAPPTRPVGMDTSGPSTTTGARPMAGGPTDWPSHARMAVTTNTTEAPCPG